MSKCDLAFASKSTSDSGSVLILNGSNVARPISVGVTPTAADAHARTAQTVKTRTTAIIALDAFFISLLLPRESPLFAVQVAPQAPGRLVRKHAISAGSVVFVAPS